MNLQTAAAARKMAASVMKPEMGATRIRPRHWSTGFRESREIGCDPAGVRRRGVCPFDELAAGRSKRGAAGPREPAALSPSAGVRVARHSETTTT